MECKPTVIPEKEKAIRFSHDYFKFYNLDEGMPTYVMKNGEKLTLIAVQRCLCENIPERIIKFDSEYLEKGDIKRYPLPPGDVLILVFVRILEDHRAAYLATIRRWDPLKEEWYKARLFKEFKLVIA